MSAFREITAEELQGNPFRMIGKGWMLITAGSDKCNTMTASWGGMGVMWGRNVSFVVIRPQRYTKEFVDREDLFSLSFLGEEHRKKLSYLGAVSGRDEDKIAKTGLTVARDGAVPYFDEADTVLICKKLFRQPYDPASFLDQTIITEMYPQKDFHTLYVSEITKVLVK